MSNDISVVTFASVFDKEDTLVISNKTKVRNRVVLTYRGVDYLVRPQHMTVIKEALINAYNQKQSIRVKLQTDKEPIVLETRVTPGLSSPSLSINGNTYTSNEDTIDIISLLGMGLQIQLGI